MSEVNRRFRLIIDQSAAADLTRAKEADPWAYAKIFALIQEYSSGTFSPEELIDETFESDDIENVAPFWHLQESRKNVYRIKMIMVRNWRILTAGDRKSKEVAILAVMHRSQDYQKDAALVERIRRSYEKLGFSELGR